MKHSPTCVIYCRVSTAKQSQNNESLNEQVKACQRVADEQGYTVVGIYSEACSGRKDSRPIYDELRSFLKKKSTTVDYLLVRVLDRFTRGGSGSYLPMKTELRGYGVELIDTYGIIQPTKNVFDHLGFEYSWSRSSPSEIAEVVVTTADKRAANKILERTIEAEILLTQEGYKVRAPNYGYLNQKVLVDGKKRTIQAPDPERAKYIRAMFDLRATRRFSDKEIVDRVNEMGYLSKPKNRWNKEKTEIIGSTPGIPLTVTALQKLIRRTAYAGVICEKWTHHKPIRAKYKGLVSIETFNKANKGAIAIIEDAVTKQLSLRYKGEEEQKTRIYKQYHPEFPYKFVRCPTCNKRLYGSASKGKTGAYFPAYHCSRGHKRFSVPQAKLHDIVETYINSLQFTDTAWELVENSLVRAWKEKKQEREERKELSLAQLETLREKQRNLALSIASVTSTATIAVLEEQINSIEDEIQRTSERTNTENPFREEHLRAAVVHARNILELPQKTLLNKEDPREQERCFRLIFDEVPTFDELCFGTPRLSLIYKANMDIMEGKICTEKQMAAHWKVLWNSVVRWIVGILRENQNKKLHHIIKL